MGVSAPSLHRESTDSDIRVSFYFHFQFQVDFTYYVIKVMNMKITVYWYNHNMKSEFSQFGPFFHLLLKKCNSITIYNKLIFACGNVSLQKTYYLLLVVLVLY